MTHEAKDDPSTPSINYMTMSPRWAKVNALLGGTETMRGAGETYLPRYPAESENAYRARTEMAVLYNVTKLTLGSWVGRPFSDPVKVEEDVPESISSLMEDVDLQGNSLTVFTRAWFSDAVAKGFSHVLVDFSQTDTGEERTLDDDRRENVRPFMIHVPPENLIFARGEIINGVDQLTQIRIRESTTEMDGFKEIRVQWVREMTLGEGQIDIALWRFIDEKEGWKQQEAPPPMQIPFIPLITFYAENRDDLMLNVPPLIHLADLNVRHWQSTADQNNILSVARFPMLAGSGMIGDAEIIVGPHQILTNPSKDSRFYYVEHSGKAIAAGRADLQDLETQMAQYGAEFLKKRPGRETATARALDSAEATSPLQDIAIRFQSSLQQVFACFAKWLNEENGGTAKVAVDFGPEVAESEDLKTLVASRANRDISRRTYLMELKRRGVLADEFDIEADKAVLEDEAMSLLADEPDNDNQGNQPSGNNSGGEGDNE